MLATYSMLRFGISALCAMLAAAKDGSDFNGDEYIALSRTAKQDKIWARVTENTKSGSWHLQGALIVDQAPVFDTPGDELECGWTGCRNKTIHAHGNVAKIEWKNTGGHPYTGMFKGADAGFARLSVAKPVDNKTPNLAPGMGVKLLRDGHDSANFVCMYSVDGQDSLNFFANDFVNHIPDPHSLSLKPLEARFATQTDWIQTVGLSEMASFTQDGQAEASAVFPFSLRFKPGGAYSFPDSKDPNFNDFRDQLASIAPETILYEVYAMDKPTELGGTESKIAQIVTKSEMTTSNFGDEHLYFRHERMDDDLALRPEWEPYTPKYGGIFSLEQQEDGSDCPFANILQYLQ